MKPKRFRLLKIQHSSSKYEIQLTQATSMLKKSTRGAIGQTLNNELRQKKGTCLKENAAS